MTLECGKCGKRLSKKRARVIAGKLLCSPCMFGGALAAATGTAKTAKPVECEASQSGPDRGNAQPLEDSHD